MNALIFNSAHNKYPLGKDSWIQATVRTVGKLSDSTDTIISSLDPMPWSFVTYLAGRYGMNSSLIIPAPPRIRRCDRQALYDDILDDFNLDGSKVQPVYPDESGSRAQNRKTFWQLRDRVAVETAQLIFPVSIRPGGRLSRLLDDDAVRTKIRNDFRIQWSSEGYIPRYTLTDQTINRLTEGDWLVHWTRASQGPWPGEKSWRFYHDMLENPGEYVRSAGATLARIVSELRLRGSSWKLPEGEQAVAFTAQPIEEALRLMRWRQRYVRYTFEPYGIAIRLAALLDMGAGRVSYSRFQVSGSRQKQPLSGEDRLFIHAAGEKTDWEREKEWRIRGDLSLETLDGKDMFALVPDNKAREEVLRKMERDIAVHVIFKDM